MKRTGKPIDRTHPSKLTYNELVEECNRLEALLDSGELSVKEGRKLAQIRAEIETLEILKYGV